MIVTDKQTSHRALGRKQELESTFYNNHMLLRAATHNYSLWLMSVLSPWQFCDYTT